MTRLFVNDREVPYPPSGVSSLDGILKHVEGHYLPPDYVIRQVRIDGLPLVPAELNEAPPDLFEGLEKRQRIEVTTGSQQEIACESLREAISYLERIEGVIPSLASSFQAYPGPQAFANLRDLYTGFYWLNLLLDRLEKSFAVALSEIQLEGVALPEHHRRFLSILQQLVDSQEKRDFVLVADLLEYEILPIVPLWKQLFRSIGERIELTPKT
jgi:hypothetical protein